MPEITLELPGTVDAGSPSTPAVTERQPTDPATQSTEVKVDKPVSVDIKTWAKTSAQNRELTSKAAELQAKVDELSKVNPDAESALNAKLVEMLKSPGTAKRLVTDGGRTFDDIIAELTDIQVEDPAVTATNARLAAIEADRKAEKEANEAAKVASDKAATDRAIAAGHAEITKFATNASNNATIHDEKDPRDGTERWACVAQSESLIETARSEVTAYINANHPKGVSEANAQLLVEQALDQLELLERKKLAPLLSKLVPAGRTTSRGNSHQETRKRVTETESHFDRKPTTITESIKGPMPTKSPSKRYSGGPRAIRFDDLG